MSLQLLKIPANHAAQNTAKAYIALKLSSVVEVEQAKFTTVSAECCSSKEVEEVADRLIKELKVIKKQAVTFFEKQREKEIFLLKQTR